MTLPPAAPQAARRRRPRTQVVASIALAFFAVGLFGEAVFSSRILFQRDILLYIFPEIESFVRVVSSGSLPLWNPYFGFGRPLLADPAYQALYPPTWLNLVVSPALYYKVFVVVHCFAAGVAVFLLLRRRGLTAPAAAMGGVCWMGSGPLLSLASMNHHFAGACLMAWVLWALDRLWARPCSGTAALLAAASTLQVLAGSGDMCLMTALVALPITLGRRGSQGDSGRHTWGAIVGYGGLALLTAVALSALQWAPALDLVGRSARRGLDPATNLYWSLHPASLLELLSPQIFSNLPLTDEVRRLLFEGREALLPSLYLGAAATGLVLLALTSRQDRRVVAWLSGLAAFLVWFALGRNGGLATWLVSVPVFKLFRYPTKYLVPAALVWALLAGYGFEHWQRLWGEADHRRARWLALSAVAAVLLFLAVAQWTAQAPAALASFLNLPAGSPHEAYVFVLRPTVAKLRVVAAVWALWASLIVWRRFASGAGKAVIAATLTLVAVDLWQGNSGTNRLAPETLATQRPATLQSLKSGDRVLVHGVSTATLNRQVVRGPRGWDREWSWILGLEELLLAPGPARWGILGSFDDDFTGLTPEPAPFVSQAVRQRLGSPFGGQWLRISGTNWVVGYGGPAVPDAAEVVRFESVFASPIVRARVPGALPRCYLVEGARRIEHVDAQAIALLGSPAFVPAREVALEATERAALPGFDGAARVVEQRATRVLIESAGNRDAFVVLLDSFDEGWRAWVDGRPAPILRANLLFRAVAVPAGRHVTEMRYLPSAVKTGALLSAGGALLLACLLLRERRRRSANQGAIRYVARADVE